MYRARTQFCARAQAMPYREIFSAMPEGTKGPGAQRERLDAFFEALREAPCRVLMLDYDGTLAPFRMEPHSALPYPGICELLDTIEAITDTRVVIVSGRWIRDLIPLLGLRRLPELWGSHGRERLGPDGRYEFLEIAPDSLRALFQADAWEAQVRQSGGRVERKPASLAIHWRGLSGGRIDQIRAFVDKGWEMLPGREGLDLRRFDGGIEVVVRGCSKATAVATILSESGPGAVAAYLGDDLTDEDALGAIRGRGLGVLVSDSPRRSVADVWLRPPQEVRAFLKQWAQTCGGGAEG